MTGRAGWLGAAGWVLLLGLGADAQTPTPTPVQARGAGILIDNGVGPYYQPPGQYGTSYGVPSYGTPRTYSAFSSPYGGGYGYGYAPYVYGLNGFTLNGGGISMVRPGFSVPGYVYGSSYYGFGGSRYNTFPAPFTIVGPSAPPPPPPFGLYAPAFGPPSFYAN